MLLQPCCTVTAADSAQCCLQVGDIVQIQKDSFFPADLLLLAVPESVEGIAYVETINLDGESNLKIKKALDETQDLKLDTLPEFTVGIILVYPAEYAKETMHEWNQRMLKQALRALRQLSCPQARHVSV